MASDRAIGAPTADGWPYDPADVPRFAFAVPFLPHQRRTWASTADAVLSRHASEHRQLLLERGIFKERVWMQVGRGTPPLSLVLLDCDDVDRLFTPPSPTASAHERWLASEVIEEIHGIRPASTFAPPATELLSGTTTMATATAGTQTMFALPLPTEAIRPVRKLVARIEHGDLAQSHGRFLADTSIREEWIWLQHPTGSCPALLLIHWIGDDLDSAWQRLTFVRDDDYARVLHEALFTRLAGISPEEVAGWNVEPLLTMHVRRTDGRLGNQQRLARRLFGAVAKGATAAASDLLAGEVRFTRPDGGDVHGREAVISALDALGAPSRTGQSVQDVMAGQDHLFALLRDDDQRVLALLATVSGGRVTHIQQLTPPPA